MDHENFEVPSFTQEQLDEFNKLTGEFLVKHFPNYIGAIEIEVKYNPPDREILEDAHGNFEPNVPVILSLTRCKIGNPPPGDPCTFLGPNYVWK